MTCPCFLCGVIPQGKSPPPADADSHSHVLKESLQTIFLLRQVLDLPSPFLEGVLLRHGHPSEWVSLCVPCGEEVTKGRDLFLEIHKLQKDLSALKNVLRDKALVKRESGSETEEVCEAAIEIKDFLWNQYEAAFVHPLNEEEEFQGFDFTPELDDPLAVDDFLDEVGIVELDDEEEDEEMPQITCKRRRKKGRKRLAPRKQTCKKQKHVVVENQHQEKRGCPKKPSIQKKSDGDDSISINISSAVEILQRTVKEKIAEKEDEQIMEFLLEAGSEKDKDWEQDSSASRSKTSSDFAEEISEQQRSKRTSHPTTSQPFTYGRTCFYCSLELENVDEYEDHIRSSHTAPLVLTCSGCGVLLTARDEFSAHIQDDICRNFAIRCDNDKCSEKNLLFSSQKALEIHKHLVHQNYREKRKKRGAKKGFFVCICGFTATHIINLMTHFRHTHLFSGEGVDDDEIVDLSENGEQTIEWKDVVNFFLFKMREQFPSEDKLFGQFWPPSIPDLVTKYGIVSDIKCPFCLSVFNTVEDLISHAITCEEKKGFKCAECLTIFYTGAELEKHIRISHTEKEELVCKGCEVPFIIQSEFEKHIRSVPDTSLCKVKAISCDKGKCSAPLKPNFLCSEKALIIHNFSRHGTHSQFTHICPKKDCGRSFNQDGAVFRHLKEDHNSAPEQICHLCGKIFEKESYLKTHISEVHKTREPGAARFICDICGKEMVTSGKLKRHKQIHIPPEEAPHLCTLCGKRFRLKEYLTIHNRSHDPDRREKYSSYKPRKRRPPGYVNLGVGGARKGRPPKESSDFLNG